MILYEDEGLKVIQHDTGAVEVWKDNVLIREHYPFKCEIVSLPRQTIVRVFDVVDWLPDKIEVTISDGKIYAKTRYRGGSKVWTRYKKTKRKEFSIGLQLKELGIKLKEGIIPLKLEKKEGDLFIFAPA